MFSFLFTENLSNSAKNLSTDNLKKCLISFVNWEKGKDLILLCLLYWFFLSLWDGRGSHSLLMKLYRNFRSKSQLPVTMSGCFGIIMHPLHPWIHIAIDSYLAYLTFNFELWVKNFCVPTCCHMRIPKSCLSVRTPWKEITLTLSMPVLQQ